MTSRTFAPVFGAVPILACLALPPAWAEQNPDVVTYQCNYPDAPLDPNTITVNLKQGWVIEDYNDPNAPTKFKMINGKADKYGDVLSLTITDTMIDINISNPDPADADDDEEQRIDRVTGTTVVSKPMFVGTGHCTKIEQKAQSQ